MQTNISTFGKWMALTAALLGWLFDGLEMGLFPLVARPALLDLGIAESDVIAWNGYITALFLVGAATGGVLFGWLGDRIGRVRSMMLSVLTYALVSGMCGFATAPWQVGALRFIAALGMGGEWSLGVALINEIWPARSRAFLAGLIGAAANVGYLLIALAGLGLAEYVNEFGELLGSWNLSTDTVDYLLSTGDPARHPEANGSGWRLLMMLGAVPALLTFMIRLFVPESQKWEQERKSGATSHWANRDLLGVLVGAGGACGIVVLWILKLPLAVQILGTVVGLVLVTGGYLWPVIFYLRRSAASPGGTHARGDTSSTLKLMLLAACLSGVALLGTWGTTQQAPTWASQLAGAAGRSARADTQIWGALGAILGTILAALTADWLGRRVTYTLLCLGSLIMLPTFFLTQTQVDGTFLFMMFLCGMITASFYGWLPLYLPELFPTRVRATGQGFGFNFGRVIAAIGVLQLGNLKALFAPLGWKDPQVYAALSGIYVVGMILIWFVPETKGKPLPE